MTEFSVRYTCSLYQSPNKAYSVDVPWEETTDIPLTTEAVWNLVSSDKTLLKALLGDDFTSYEDRAHYPEHYGSYLRRVNEAIFLKIEAPEELTEAGGAPVRPKKSLKRIMKKLLRRGTDIDPDSSSTTFIRAYTKD